MKGSLHSTATMSFAYALVFLSFHKRQGQRRLSRSLIRRQFQPACHYVFPGRESERLIQTYPQYPARKLYSWRQAPWPPGAAMFALEVNISAEWRPQGCRFLATKSTNWQLYLAMSPWGFDCQEIRAHLEPARKKRLHRPEGARLTGSEGCQLAPSGSRANIRAGPATDRTLDSDWSAACPRRLDMIFGFSLWERPMAARQCPLSSDFFFPWQEPCHGVLSLEITASDLVSLADRTGIIDCLDFWSNAWTSLTKLGG